VLSKSLGADNPRTRRAAARLAKLYTAWERRPLAAQYSQLAAGESP